MKIDFRKSRNVLIGFFRSRYFSVSLSVLVCFLFVFAFASSTTTIGTNITTSGTLTVTGSTTFNGVTYGWPSADGTSGQVLSTNGSGALSWSSGSQWTTSGSNIYFSTGNVGIGTTSPTTALSIQGSSPTLRLTDSTSGEYLRLLKQNSLNKAVLYNRVLRTYGTSHALQFLGTGQLVSVVEAPAFDFTDTDSFTVTFWIKTSSTAQQWLVNKHTIYSSNGYVFGISDAVICGNGNGLIGFYTASPENGSACSNSSIADGNWHFVVGVYNGETSTTTLYVDGVAQTQQGSRTGTLTNDADLNIGNLSQLAGYDFNGYLDEVIIWNKALTQSEITLKYNDGNGVSESPATNLVAGWHFDEGVGFGAADLLNGSRGNISGSPVWVEGKIEGASSDNIEIEIFSSENSSSENEEGVLKIGDEDGGLWLRGMAQHFYISGSEKMTINSTGNIGLGTTSPYAKLSVNHDAGETPFIIGSSTASTLIVNSDGYLGLSTTSPFANLSIDTTNIIDGGSSFFVGTSTATSTGNFFSIDKYGRVGIGSTAPSKSLTINGTSIITQDSTPIARDATSTQLDAPNGLFISGKYAYVASTENDKFVIFDISNPDNIILKGYTSDSLDYPMDVFVSGDYAYVTSELNSAFVIFDVSDPNNIVTMASTTVGLSQPRNIVVSGRYAYVTDITNDALVIFDVSNPHDIVYKGSTSASLDYPHHVKVVGNYAYVASHLNNTFAVFDVSDPTNIILATSTTQDLNSPRYFDISGSYAYVGSTYDNKLVIFDISDHNNIVWKGNISGVSGPVYAAGPVDVHVSGRYAFIALADVVKIYDVSNPSAIFLKSSFSIPSSAIEGKGYVWGLGVNGKYLYTTEWYGDRLAIYELNGMETISLSADSAGIYDLSVYDNAKIYGGLTIGDYLMVDSRVLMRDGLAVSGTSTSYFETKLGLGTTTPLALLTVGSSTPAYLTSAQYYNSAYISGQLEVGGTGTSTFAGYIDVLGASTATSTFTGNLWVKGTLRAAVSYTGDLIFANNFRFTEAPLDGSPQALILKNKNGEDLFAIDETGLVTFKDIVADTIKLRDKIMADKFEMKSPNGTIYCVTIGDDGVMRSTAGECSIAPAEQVTPAAPAGDEPSPVTSGLETPPVIEETVPTQDSTTAPAVEPAPVAEPVLAPTIEPAPASALPTPEGVSPPAGEAGTPTSSESVGATPPPPDPALQIEPPATI